MERILVILNRERTADAVLTTAGRLASRLGTARITVLHPRLPEDPSFMPTEEIMTPDRQLQFNRVSAARAAHLRDVVASWQASLPAGQQVRSLEVIGKPAQVVGAEATQADLVVLGHVLPDDRDDARLALHTALFVSGAPVVVAPMREPDTVGVHPAIGWESGPAMEAAVQAALPLLLKAEAVTFLVGDEGGGGTAPEPQGGVRQSLEQARVHCDMMTFQARGREVGAALLAEAKAAGADLIVMGAYTHAGLIERILGGATKELLQHADLPLLLHHGRVGS